MRIDSTVLWVVGHRGDPCDVTALFTDRSEAELEAAEQTRRQLELSARIPGGYLPPVEVMTLHEACNSIRDRAFSDGMYGRW